MLAPAKMPVAAGKKTENTEKNDSALKSGPKFSIIVSTRNQNNITKLNYVRLSLNYLYNYSTLLNCVCVSLAVYGISNPWNTQGPCYNRHCFNSLWSEVHRMPLLWSRYFLGYSIFVYFALKVPKVHQAGLVVSYNTEIVNYEHLFLKNVVSFHQTNIKNIHLSPFKKKMN